MNQSNFSVFRVAFRPPRLLWPPFIEFWKNFWHPRLLTPPSISYLRVGAPTRSGGIEKSAVFHNRAFCTWNFLQRMNKKIISNGRVIAKKHAISFGFIIIIMGIYKPCLLVGKVKDYFQVT